jgi:hypothetical protein
VIDQDGFTQFTRRNNQIHQAPDGRNQASKAKKPEEKEAPISVGWFPGSSGTLQFQLTFFKGLVLVWFWFFIFPNMGPDSDSRF